eukprot:TRINITY_DN27298_c1_g1_i1.p1 TRINITY_DN27298_c1_g1~~TRINITY_DN27298_c1_g1_i1.p1  ORF type:complete len:1045 (+),score=494.81 TRINITY_DN27298_c1_g1_i1:78-3137(+)
MTEPYGVVGSDGSFATSLRSPRGKKGSKDERSRDHAIAQEGAHVTPLGASTRKDVVLALQGEPQVSNFKTYLRLRPYFPSEIEDCKKQSIDVDRSCVEFDEAKGNAIEIQDPQAIGVKPRAVPPKKTWKGQAYSKLLWSFNDLPKRWADDIQHTYYDQRSTFNALTDSEQTVKAMYNGYSQAVAVYGAPLTGKTFTALGDATDGDNNWGLAPRILQSIWEGRKAYTRVPLQGEILDVVIDVTLLRVWKEVIEDFTNPTDPSPVRITGEGVLEGHTPLTLSSQRDVNDAINRILKLGKRKERRSSIVVQINVLQVSRFETATDHVAADDGKQATEALKASTYTIVDIGAGNRMESESQNDGRLITKARTAVARVFDLLRSKSEADLQAAYVDPVVELKNRREKKDREKSWQGNGVLLGRYQKEVDRKNDHAPDSYEGEKHHKSEASTYTLPKVPYKESRLTQLLCDQLGGCCQTRVVCCITPYYKHTVDNGLTIDFGRSASVIRSKCFLRQERDLAKLREMNEEKVNVQNKAIELSKDVQKVQEVLLGRQNQINKLMAHNTQLHNVLADKQQGIEEMENVRHSYSKAICAVQTLMESGPINKELQQRILDAVKEQEEIRRKMAKLRAEMLAMEVASGERDVEEMEQELHEAEELVFDALRMVGYAVEAEAKMLLEGEVDGDTWHIGDTVKVRRDDEWTTMKIKKMGGDKYTVTGKDITGKTTEEEYKKDEIFSPKKKKQGDFDKTAMFSDSPLDGDDHSTSLLMSNVKTYLDNHAEGQPTFTDVLQSELKYAKDRLTAGGSVAPSKRDPLEAGLKKCNEEFEKNVKDRIEDVVPSVSQGMKDRTSGAFKKRLDIAITDSAQPLGKRLGSLRETEKTHANLTLDKRRAAAALVRGVNGNVDEAPTLDEVKNAIELVFMTKERLAVLMDYAQMRGVLEDGLQEWTDAMSSSFVQALKLAEEGKKLRADAEAKEKEAKDAENDASKEEAALAAAKSASESKQKALEGKKKSLAEAQQKCCVVM